MPHSAGPCTASSRPSAPGRTTAPRTSSSETGANAMPASAGCSIGPRPSPARAHHHRRPDDHPRRQRREEDEVDQQRPPGAVRVGGQQRRRSSPPGRPRKAPPRAIAPTRVVAAFRSSCRFHELPISVRDFLGLAPESPAPQPSAPARTPRTARTGPARSAGRTRRGSLLRPRRAYGQHADQVPNRPEQDQCPRTRRCSTG